MLTDMQLLTGSISDLNWFKNNSETIKSKYEGEIVAIKDESIVAFGPTIDILFRKLSEKGIEESEVIIQYVSPDNQIIIL